MGEGRVGCCGKTLGRADGKALKTYHRCFVVCQGESGKGAMVLGWAGAITDWDVPSPENFESSWMPPY